MNLKYPAYSSLLKILAAAAVGCFFYAAVLTVRSAIFGKDGGFSAAAFFLLIMLFGHFIGRVFLENKPAFINMASDSRPVKFISFMLGRENTANWASAAVAWALVLVPFLLILIIYGRSGAFRLIFELLAAVTAYSIALKHSQQTFSQIMGNTAAYTGFTVLAMSLETANLLKEITYLKPWLFAISYFFILAFLIIKNQEDIDKNIFAKKHVEKSVLPRNLRRFNTFWVCMLFLAIVLFFNLQPVVAFLLKLFGRLLIYAVAAFGWLLDHIFYFSSSPRQGSPPNSPGFFGSGLEIVHPLKNLIFNVLMYTVLLYLAYKLIFFIVKSLPGFVRKIIKLLEKLFSINRDKSSFVTSDYSDESETIKPAKEYAPRRHLKKKTVRSRLSGNISDPAEKVRAMYGCILAELPECGIRLEHSDTTAEILEKAAVSPDISYELDPFTGIYNQVRYGGKIPDSVMLAAAEANYKKAVNYFIALRRTK